MIIKKFCEDITVSILFLSPFYGNLLHSLVCSALYWRDNELILVEGKVQTMHAESSVG
jgi:hypothetical protein